MRLLLAALTIGLVLSVDMNSVPMRGNSGLESAATANPAPTDQLDAETGEASEVSIYAGQIAGVGKTDRLFAVRQPDVSITDDDAAVQPDTPAAVLDVPAQLTMGEFCEALTKAAAESDIPPAFFARLIWQESKFKHDARSPVGAQGVAQFMPRTAAEMGLDDPFDPRKALPASAKFLRRLHDQFGNLGLAAAAYNAGSGRIQNWLARRGPLPDETRDYVRKVTGNAAEKWTAEKHTVALQVDLPREAPCEGIGGLSRDRDVEATKVLLTPGISGVIRKAAEEAARAAAAAKERLRLALIKSPKKKALLMAAMAKAGDKDVADAPAGRKSVIIQIASGKVSPVKVSPAKASPIRIAASAHRKARSVRVASAK